MIRQATVQDIPEILRIYDAARAFMRRSGNLTQWSGGYPSEEIVRADIEKNVLWGMENERGHLCAVFALVPGEDPSYAVIDGAWRDPSPYAAMHRAASDGTERGTFRAMLDFVRTRYDHLRVDTHADNHPMQHGFLTNGFVYCGIVRVWDGTPRRAYEWSKGDYA